MRNVLLLCMLFASCLPGATTADPLRYEAAFFPAAHYPEDTPAPADCLEFPLGRRAATPGEIGRCLDAWAQVSPRMHVETYARSHEGRPLRYVLLGTPERIERRDALRESLGHLADPRGLSAAEAEALLDELPAVAWLAYSIHGDETSGADAALAVVHHLAFDASDATRALLDALLVIVDPMMNPDGRRRFLQQVAQHRGRVPDVDDQSLLHTGYWPWGRTNHYLFDLNRDWLFGIQPETRGRMEAVRQWHPLLFVDAHEMGPQESYLFSPSRDPHNPNLPEWQRDWSQVFARDQATAFDEHGWRYYTGEWNEGWYPGYSDAWASLGGAVGILYEQAGVADAGVRQGHGQVLTYAESVHHQVVSSMANLETLAREGAELKRGWLAQQRRAVSGDSPYARRTFAVLPTDNHGRLQAFLDTLALHGIEVHRLSREITVSRATDQLGRERTRLRLPEGTLLIPNRQPAAHRVAAVLEFDPRIPDETLAKERDKLLREGETRIYDTTAWNLTMLHGLDALTLPTGLPDGAEPLQARESGEPPEVPRSEGVGWFFPGADDRSLAAAARLLQDGVRVRVARKDSHLGDTPLAAGSPVVLRTDNRELDGDLAGRLTAAARAAGIPPGVLSTGLGPGDLPDLGGEHFPLVPAPRVALVSRGRISAYDYGSLWHHLDQRLGLKHSQITEDRLGEDDLRRYNVIVLPDRRRGEYAPEALEALRAWVKDGGTLIAVGGSAALLATQESKLASTRQLPEALDDILPFRVALAREWQALKRVLPAPGSVWSHRPPEALDHPWELEEESIDAPPSRASGEPTDNEDGEQPGPLTPAQHRDAWQARFMPQGAVLAARVDRHSWLNLGVGDFLPVLTGNAPVLMAADPVQAPLRYGLALDSGEESLAEPRLLGWAPVPGGVELRLRMSGLLWPEAAQRLANAAWVTREGIGRGQVILFASPPVFRGATLGTARVLSNAVLYGAGLGATTAIEPR